MVHPFTAQLGALLVRPATADVNQQAPQEGRRFTDNPRCRDTSAAAAPDRRSPRADGGPLMPTPLGSGTGARF